MKKLKWYLLSSLIPLFFPVFIIIIIMGAVGEVALVALLNH